MGRFVYQPVPSDMEEYSKHGQLIADIYSGHISVNHHNVIVSATRRIEDKLEDVFQIENNINEQTNVINNLSDDYYMLIDNQYALMLKDFDAIKMDVVIQKGVIAHLKRGIGSVDSEDSFILQELVDAIHNMLNIYEKASNSQREKIDETVSIISTSNDALKEFTLTISGKAVKHNLNDFISKVDVEISDQRADINVLKNNVLGKLG